MALMRPYPILRCKAFPIIFDPKHNVSSPIVEINLRQRCLRMFDYVGKGFLTDSEQIILDDFRQRTNPSLGRDLHLDAGSINDLTAAEPQGAWQIKLLERPAPEIPNGPAHFDLALAH